MSPTFFIKYQVASFSENTKLFTFKIVFLTLWESSSINIHALILPSLQRACRERVLPFPVSFFRQSLAIFEALNTNTEVIKLALAVHVANFNSYYYNIKIKIFAYQKLRGGI